jgi:hypothetical protein
MTARPSVIPSVVLKVAVSESCKQPDDGRGLASETETETETETV